MTDVTRVYFFPWEQFHACQQGFQKKKRQRPTSMHWMRVKHAMVAGIKPDRRFNGLAIPMSSFSLPFSPLWCRAVLSSADRNACWLTQFSPFCGPLIPRSQLAIFHNFISDVSTFASYLSIAHSSVSHLTLLGVGGASSNWTSLTLLSRLSYPVRSVSDQLSWEGQPLPRQDKRLGPTASLFFLVYAIALPQCATTKKKYLGLVTLSIISG